MKQPTTTLAAKPSLQSDACSLAGGIALAAAAMAPALAVVLNAPAAAPSAGGALPLAFLIAFCVCLLVGNTVISFARRVPPTAGSFYSYNMQGLGRPGGLLTGWLLFLGYAILAPGLFTALGYFSAEYVHNRLNLDVPWWCFSLIGLFLVMLLSLRGIRASVRVDLVMLIIEIGIFLLLAVLVVAVAGIAPIPAGFTPSASPTGWPGIGMGVVFGILSFIGFDAAVTLSEETRNARRNTPLAVGGTLILCGIFYLVTISALTAGNLHGSSSILELTRRDAPGLEHPVAICAVAGIFSCFLAVHNTTARVLFSLGRDRVLPRALGRVHPRWNSPHWAMFTQGGFTLVIGIFLGAWLGPGVDGAYGFTGAIGAMAIILVWMLSGISLIRYTHGTPHRQLLPHVIMPAISVLTLIYPLWAMLTTDDVSGQTYQSHWVPAVLVFWLLAGAGGYTYGRCRKSHIISGVESSMAEARGSHNERGSTCPPPPHA